MKLSIKLPLASLTSLRGIPDDPETSVPIPPAGNLFFGDEFGMVLVDDANSYAIGVL